MTRSALFSGLVLLALLLAAIRWLVPAYAPAPRTARPATPAAPTPARPARPLRIVWGGDLTPGSRYGLPGGFGRAQLANVRPLLRRADLALVNLEGTLTAGGPDKCAGSASNACFAFAAPPAWVAGLRWAGIDAVNLANNHAWDFGAEGQRQTLRALAGAGLAWSGRPGELRIVRVRGVRVALLGFAPYRWASDLRDPAAATALVRSAAARAELVVCMLHAGAEGSDRGHTPRGREWAFGEDRGAVRPLARALVRAGADLVVGSGPHVVRGVERYRGRLIAYSLGNLAGWHNFATAGALGDSALLEVRLDAGGRLHGARWQALRLDGAGAPQLDPRGASAQRMRTLGRQDFGAAAWTG